MISFDKFLKYRVGIYCNDCFLEYTVDGVACMKCNKKFIPLTVDKSIFCSIKRFHSHIVTEKHKQKTRTTVCKKLNHYDSDGNLLDSIDALKIIKLNREKDKRRELGIKEKFTLTHELICTRYDNKGCTLLTTKEEFNELKSNQKMDHIRLKIKSSCGHLVDILWMT